MDEKIDDKIGSNFNMSVFLRCVSYYFLYYFLLGPFTIIIFWINGDLTLTGNMRLHPFYFIVRDSSKNPKICKKGHKC